MKISKCFVVRSLLTSDHLPKRGSEKGREDEASCGDGACLWRPDIRVTTCSDREHRAAEQTAEEAKDAQLNDGLREASSESEDHGQRDGDTVDDETAGGLADGRGENRSKGQAEHPQAER